MGAAMLKHKLKKKMSQVESGRLGGLSTKRRHGVAHLQRAGRLGGLKLKERFGPAYFEILGRRGGRPKNEAADTKKRD